MQTLDVQAQNPVKLPPISGVEGVKAGPKAVANGKTGAETARNGSSFLAMIEKMIAGTMEGKADALTASSLKTTARGAGDSTGVPGEENTLIKPGSAKTAKSSGKSKVTAELYSAAGLSAADSSVAVQGKKLQENTEKSGLRADRKKSGSFLPASVSVSEDDVLSELKAATDKKPGIGLQKTAVETAIPVTVSHAAMPIAVTARDESMPGVKTDGGTEAVGKGDRKAEKTDRKDRKTFISVRDERNQTDFTIASATRSQLEKSVQVTSDGTADMTIGFSAANTGSSSRTDIESRFMEQGDGKQGQSFASMLSSELRSNAADFVKTGSIVLRDNNSGLIRLTLNPESLGNVKISLELSENRITGKITVSSKEAYDAFNENLDGLSDAFVQGGFESAGFDLSWSGKDSSGYGQETEQGKLSAPFYASSIPSVMSATNAADTNMSGYRYNTSSAVNVFA